MLHRKVGAEVIIITQPAHAWVSGQLAQQWGNEHFQPASEEVRFATEQHDVGFLDWEQAPTLNQETGLPHKFTEMPTPMHLEIWRKGINQVLRFSRYSALLVSKHFTVLAHRHDTGDPPCPESLVQKFIREQESLQQSILNSLRQSGGKNAASDAIIERDYKALAIWDWISLLILINEESNAPIPDVPSSDGRKRLQMKRLDSGGFRFSLSPWPFQHEGARVTCEGKLLRDRFSTEAEMRKALHSAEITSIPIQFQPG